MNYTKPTKMRMKKIMTVCIFFLGISLTGFAQSEDIKQQAKEKVNEINDQIISVNEFLELTDDQKGEIQSILEKRLKEIDKAKRKGMGKNEIKKISKKYFQKIHKEVLNSKQKEAIKQAKERMKGKD